ncbi:MAG: hypothetical protein WCO89_06490 [Syntrophus sp. (in: bacteria)]
MSEIDKSGPGTQAMSTWTWEQEDSRKPEITVLQNMFIEADRLGNWHVGYDVKIKGSSNCRWHYIFTARSREGKNLFSIKSESIDRTPGEHTISYGPTNSTPEGTIDIRREWNFISYWTRDFCRE